MTGKIEMSLDDIIKQNRSNRKANQKNKRQGGGGGAKGKAARKPAGKATGKPMRKPMGGVKRGRNVGGISRNRPNFGGGRSMPSQKRDAFLGSAQRRFGSSSEATKLIVSNLDFGVTDSDIVELFGEFGHLKSAGVHYNMSGRSMGSADLIYERRADAIKAMKQYNGVPLDGREMKIQLATSEIPGMNPIRGGPRLGQKPQQRNQGGQTKRKGGPQRGSAPNKKGSPQGKKVGGQGQKGKPGGKKPKPAPPTAAELDAQLEEYVKSKVTSSEGA
ncbi:hypothetical protein QAD02_006505 [Eretmocerus hayati]|uniref:Uncharacterized protein n=1 Tax=Eretmocerus hayati TaxID=131215 RepID=A0ACC2N1J2_9HYME|nr:hypothetical protein QAD02_006505 [Eretmocerus hayati]